MARVPLLTGCHGLPESDSSITYARACVKIDDTG